MMTNENAIHHSLCIALLRVLRAVPRPVGMLLSLQTRQLDVSNVVLCAADPASSHVLEFCIRQAIC